MSILDTIWKLLFDPNETERYQENPEEYIAEHGLDQCDPGDLHDMVLMAYEKGPVSQGANVSVGGNQGVGGPRQVAGPGAAPSAPPPAPPVDPSLPVGQAIEQTINYYVSNTTNTYVDDRDTNIDNSVNTQVIAGDGAEIDLDIDSENVSAVGDGAVAGGGDVSGVATGDGAIAVGDDVDGVLNTGVNTGVMADDSTFEGNVVVGDGNEVVSDSTNVATGGGSVSDDDIDFQNSGHADLDNVNFGQGNTVSDDDTTTDSYNTSDSYNTTDSHNTSDSFNSDDDGFDLDIQDSFNQQSLVGDGPLGEQAATDTFEEPEPSYAEPAAYDTPDAYATGPDAPGGDPMGTEPEAL